MQNIVDIFLTNGRSIVKLGIKRNVWDVLSSAYNRMYIKSLVCKNLSPPPSRAASLIHNGREQALDRVYKSALYAFGRSKNKPWCHSINKSQRWLPPTFSIFCGAQLLINLSRRKWLSSEIAAAHAQNVSLKRRIYYFPCCFCYIQVQMLLQCSNWEAPRKKMCSLQAPYQTIPTHRSCYIQIKYYCRFFPNVL
jgi:hypothetical protein